MQRQREAKPPMSRAHKGSGIILAWNLLKVGRAERNGIYFSWYFGGGVDLGTLFGEAQNDSAGFIAATAF